MALALDQMPAARSALEEGEVTGSAVKVLVEARETDPEEFAGSEDALLGAARTVSVRELRTVVAHWRQAVSPVSVVHQGFCVEMREGRARFRRPDGTSLAPP